MPKNRKLQQAPFVLRWAFAWACLTGNVLSISYHSGSGYRIDVEGARVARWRARNEKRNAKIAAEKEAERNRRAGGMKDGEHRG